MFCSTSLPKTPHAAAQARLFLDHFRDEVGEDVFEDARLLVSELVANAVEHVREPGDLELRVTLDAVVLRVEVLDPGPGFEATIRQPDSDRGWGLQFTDRLASRWAVDHDGRARVWFELALSPS